MTREQAVDAIRSLSGGVISEYSTSAACEDAMHLECAQIIEALAPDLLDRRELEILTREILAGAVE
jgi:hypothetical protein